jgi:hypothetical protein
MIKEDTVMVTVRMDAKSREMLKERAKKLGLSVNAYCMFTFFIDLAQAGVLPAIRG